MNPAPSSKFDWLLGVALSAVLAAIYFKTWLLLLLAAGIALLYLWLNIIPNSGND